MNTTDPADRTPIRLDEDIVRVLTEDRTPEPVPAAAALRVRQRVLRRIAEAESRHLTIARDAGTWQPFDRGIEIKVLHEADGVMSYLLRLAPGAVLQPHRHPIDEECVVLEGRLRIGATLELAAGGFHLARRDALHAPITTVDGATIYLRGASPRPADLI